MNLKQLEYFVSVAELGSFSKAARMLDIAQPALSRQVRSLETDLRETLLLRNGRGITLTPAGERLFEHGIAILQQVQQAREDMTAQRDQPVGRIAIGLPPSIGRQLTLPLIDAFSRQLPAAQLAIVEGLSTHVAEWITTGRVDLGLLHHPEANPALELRQLLEESLHLVSPVQASPAAGGGSRGPLAMRELQRYPLILPERLHVIRRLIDTQAALLGLKLQVAWEVSSVAAIIDLVCAGYGHAVLTASAVAASGQSDSLIARPLVDPVVTSALCLARSTHRRETPLQRRTERLLGELVQALPQAAAAQSRPG